MGKASQWYLLFGALPLNNLDVRALFPTPEKSYRVYTPKIDLSAFLTVIGGYALTLTRKTYISQICEDDVIVTSPADILEQRAKETEGALKMLALHSPDKSASALILMDGTTVVGAIESFSEDDVVIQIEEKVEETIIKPAEENTAEPVDIITLHSGEEIHGHITNQDTRTISVSTSTGDRMIQKSIVKRIQYQVIPELTETVVTVRHTKRIIPRSQIRRIVIASQEGGG